MSARATPILVAGLLLALTGLAGWLGMQGLSHRPMHADESVHAIKFGEMLEKPGLGQYRYDPTEYHGPTLYYATHLVTRVYGKTSLEALESWHLRTTPVLFGAGLVLLLWLMRHGLSAGGVIVSALLTIVTPLINYYARDFIHETLFVFFTTLTIAAGWRYAIAATADRARVLWAGLVGAGIALMWATKEQVVLFIPAMIAGALGACLWPRLLEWKTHITTSASAPVSHNVEATTSATDRVKALARRLPWRDIIAGLSALLIIWGTLFSSFFTNWPGLLDSVTTYARYLGRGLGEGEAAAIHVRPWWHYARLLAWVSHPPAPVWTNAVILALALAGGIAGFMPRCGDRRESSLARFLAIYALALLIGLSLIPYKQPWLMMGPLHALILLAGIGAVTLIRAARHAPARLVGGTAAGLGVLLGCVTLPYQPSAAWIAGVLAMTLAGSVALGALMRLVPRSVAPILVALTIALGIGHLAYQTTWASTRFAADRRNPLAYVQTSTDVRRLTERLEELAAHHPRGRAMPIRVAAPVPWPLNWYLRRFDRVGWYDTPEDVKTHSFDVPVLIVDTRFSDLVEPRLTREYESFLFGLRPGLLLRLYVDTALWERFMAKRR